MSVQVVYNAASYILSLYLGCSVEPNLPIVRWRDAGNFWLGFAKHR